MSELTIVERNGDFEVWIGLPQHGPEDPFSFVIGGGESRAAAVAEAVANLEAVIEQLQSPPGVVEEQRYNGFTRIDEAQDAASQHVLNDHCEP